MRSSVRSDLVRFIVLLVILAAMLIGGFALIARFLQTDEATPVAVSSTTSSTSTQVSTTTTTIDPPSSTSSAPTTAATTTEPSTTTTTEATTTTAAVALDPSEVSVLVLNSTTRTGLAARFVERLDALGYQTPEPTNYPTPLDQSRVWYVEGFELEAAAVAELIPDALVEVSPQESPRAAITVVLGASFSE
jgi:cytoskeletal protein RodZ